MRQILFLRREGYFDFHNLKVLFGENIGFMIALTLWRERDQNGEFHILFEL